MLKVTVENDEASLGKSSFDVEQQGANWLVNNEIFSGDIVRLSESRYHIIWNNKSYNVEILRSNISDKSIDILINGRKYSTTTKDRIDLLLEGMGIQTQSVQKINHIKAPMPGLIQSISVVEGDHVTKGDTLLVLVAMKMENVIKATGDGIVKTLKVSAGETVEKNQVMLEFQ
jgi:acetyl/propionyl-CoA carboxylase alpha subunit